MLTIRQRTTRAQGLKYKEGWRELDIQGWGRSWTQVKHIKVIMGGNMTHKEEQNPQNKKRYT